MSGKNSEPDGCAVAIVGALICTALAVLAWQNATAQGPLCAGEPMSYGGVCEFELGMLLLLLIGFAIPAAFVLAGIRLGFELWIAHTVKPESYFSLTVNSAIILWLLSFFVFLCAGIGRIFQHKIHKSQ